MEAVVEVGCLALLAAVVEAALRNHLLVEGVDDHSRVLVVVVHHGLCRQKDHDRRTS